MIYLLIKLTIRYKAIQSGTDNLTLTATTTTGKLYNFSGTFTYVIAMVATLIINGKTYTINIHNNEVQ